MIESDGLSYQFQVKIWFQNRRTKWKKQENISNAEAAELMKAKNSQKERELVKPPAIQPPKILTENGLIIGKLSPSSSPFLRPSSSASSSTSTTFQMGYHDSFKDSSLGNKSDQDTSSSPDVGDSNLPPAINLGSQINASPHTAVVDQDEDSENRLVIADSQLPPTSTAIPLAAGNGNTAIPLAAGIGKSEITFKITNNNTEQNHPQTAQFTS